jgi:hypothetical protein
VVLGFGLAIAGRETHGFGALALSGARTVRSDSRINYVAQGLQFCWVRLKVLFDWAFGVGDWTHFGYGLVMCPLLEKQFGDEIADHNCGLQLAIAGRFLVAKAGFRL